MTARLPVVDLLGVDTDTDTAALRSQILDPTGGDILEWVGVEAPFKLGPVMAGFFRKPVPEGVS